MSELQVDQGHRVLSDLIAVFGKIQLDDANEAETRFKVIDGVLEKVLGWQKDDISVEPPCTEGSHTDYADYLIRTATTSFVVEAKRAGALFTLPNNLKSGKLGGFLSTGAIGEAIAQVRSYCVTKSAPFAVVTNGTSWIVFPAVRTDGVEFSETQAKIFRSLEDINNRFVEFWELLSRQRVIEGNLEKELLPRSADHNIRRALTLLRDPNLRLQKNTLFPHLSPAVDKVMTDEGLLTDPDALSFCYVRNTERTSFDSRLKMYLFDPKPQLGIAATRVKTSRKSLDYFDRKIESAKASQSKFFLVLGQVGAGKSTFLSYTWNVSSKDKIDPNIVWLYIDFKKATEYDVPREFIYRQLLGLIERDTRFDLGDWEKTISPAYQEEVDNLGRGPLFLLRKTDPAGFDKEVAALVMNERREVIPYVDRIISYVSSSKPIFVTVDNVDQIEDDGRQSEIFAEAQAFAQKHRVSIIMSLRDTTFRKYKSSPTFNAFEIDAIYIDAPSVVPVLARRFTYARKMLQGVKAELELDNGARFKAEDVGAFFEIAAHSLLSVDGAELIDTLSGGNIRRGLTLAREFLSSGHVTADIALQAYLTDKDWRFPTHEIFKGAILGGRKFYSEDDSLLPNMFCAKLGVPTLQLLRLVVADSLVNMAQSSNFEGVVVEELAGILHQVGIAQRELDLVLRSLVDNSIFRTTDGAPIAQDSRIVPTRLAGYLVLELMSRFDYAEMCALDAHIYDDELWGKIKEISQKIDREPDRITRIYNRIDRVKVFLDHLEIIEEKWVVEGKRRNLPQIWIQAPLKNRIRTQINKDFDRVLASAQRNYKPK